MTHSLQQITPLCPDCDAKLHRNAALLNVSNSETTVITSDHWECNNIHIDGIMLHCPDYIFKEFTSFKEIK